MASFSDLVSLRYQLYNSLFLTLPFSQLSRYGAELPLFARRCAEQLQQGDDPQAIVEQFFEKALELDTPQAREKVLFLFLQLIERQVLLFDAIEKAAGPQLWDRESEQLLQQLVDELPEGRSLRIVLTAHPTQFYPEILLGLIEDIRQAVDSNDVAHLRKLLLQMGRTSFRNHHPPTPLEEAEMLIDQFGRVLYEAFLDISLRLKKTPPKLELGFWPGGDRDGNPSVTVETTRAVCGKLRHFAREMLLKLLDHLCRRITFKGMTEPLSAIRQQLARDEYENVDILYQELEALLIHVRKEHNGLFDEEIVRVMEAVKLFGFHFASLDLRQSSDVASTLIASLCKGYEEWSDQKKVDWLSSASTPSPTAHDLIEVLQLVPEVQKHNGPKGLHRIIISHTRSATNILELFYLSQWYAESALDIVPLFESIDDMQHALEIMETVLAHAPYRTHLQSRGNTQTVMLGFSDGTKDGGYVTCNWEIQQCKERLTTLFEKEGIELIFFDGRGGPPARGGGATHKYYAAVAETVPFTAIQQTVQGQTISSYYGTLSSARYNLAQLLAAHLQPSQEDSYNLVEELSERAYRHYQALRSHPQFISLLTDTTPLSLLGELNIASRPPKRADGKQLSLENLRAISFVGAWSLMKVNVPAYYGLGYALEKMLADGKRDELREMYQHSAFFRVLIDNAIQALRKSQLPLTRYLETDREYGGLWRQLREELTRTVKGIQEISGMPSLKLQDSIAEQSVTLREQIVLPLLVIQHYALMRWRENKSDETAKKLLLKSIGPSINASRNSA